MKIIGIDPGLSTAGIGLIEATHGGKTEALDWLTITTDRMLPLQERLLILANDLEAYLEETSPELAVVETVFFATNKKTAMDTAQARGAIVVALKKRGIEVLDVTPLRLKSAITGDGSADKKQMQEMVKRTLRLDEIPTPADAADGLALALYGAFTNRIEAHAAMTPPPPTRHVRRPVT